MMTDFQHKLIVVSVFIFATMMPVLEVQATTAPDRIQSVHKLIEQSSAADKVETSGNAEAIARREEARSLFARAQRAAAAGQSGEADSLLKQATAKMYDAVQLAGKDESLLIKEVRDFDSRLASIDALCEAHERIRDEKGLPPADSSELYPLVRSKVERARQLKRQGDVTGGRKLLDEAYVAAKVAIEHLRGGDTLVRSLNFATKEEEYLYEIDRNDTHRMLVTVLLREKMHGNDRLRDKVRQYLDNADALRVEAETQASASNYTAAVKTLEKSTREIVRAIRSAGIYIPG